MDMIGKRVQRCNERITPHFSLRFDGKLSRFLTIEMRKRKHYIARLRQSHTLRCVTIVVLWIATVASIPQVTVVAAPLASHVQRILPPDPIPIASPSHFNRSTAEDAEFSTDVLSEADLEEHLHTYTILEHCCSEHARILTSSLIYTQTTSSYL